MNRIKITQKNFAKLDLVLNLFTQVKQSMNMAFDWNKKCFSLDQLVNRPKILIFPVSEHILSHHYQETAARFSENIVSTPPIKLAVFKTSKVFFIMKP